MKKILKIYVILFLLLFFSCSSGECRQDGRISQGKAFKIVTHGPNIRLATKKWRGYSTHTNTMYVDGKLSFYTFTFTQDGCGNNAVYPVCEKFSVDVDASTGKVSYSQELQQRINQEKEILRAIESEKPFSSELSRAIKEATDCRCKMAKESCDQKIKENIPIILEGLEKSTPAFRSEATRALSELARTGQYKANDAIPRLCELLKAADYGVRCNAADALGYIAEPGEEEVMVSLRTLINDPDSLVGRTSIEALGRLKDTASIPRFIELLGDVDLNQAIIRALAEIKDERAVVPLIEKFDKFDKKYAFCYLQKDIISALGEIAGKQSILFLVSLFNREYKPGEINGIRSDVRTPYMGSDAARSLAKIGRDSLPYLVESLKSQDYLQRLYSVYALGLIKDSLAIEPLNQALRIEKNQTVRIYIEKAISEINGKEFIYPLLKQQLKIWVWIEPSKKKYRLNEDVKMFLYLKNTATTPLAVSIFSCGPPCRIYGPDGKGLRSRIMYDCEGAPEHMLVTLEPGGIRKMGPYSLQKDYYFDRPGKYKVIGLYCNREDGIEFGFYALTGELEAEAVTIDME